MDMIVNYDITVIMKWHERLSFQRSLRCYKLIQGTSDYTAAGEWNIVPVPPAAVIVCYVIVNRIRLLSAGTTVAGYNRIQCGILY